MRRASRLVIMMVTNDGNDNDNGDDKDDHDDEGHANI